MKTARSVRLLHVVNRTQAVVTRVSQELAELPKGGEVGLVLRPHPVGNADGTVLARRIRRKILDDLDAAPVALGQVP